MPGTLLVLLAMLADDPAPKPPVDLWAVVSIALRRSPSLEIAADQALAARVRRDTAASRFSPKLSPSFGLGTDPFSGPRREFGFNASQTLPTGTEIGVVARAARGVYSLDGTSVDYAVHLSQSLVQAAGPALTFERWSADRAVASAARGAEDIRQRIVLDAADAYFGVVRARRVAAAAALAIARAERLKAASAARAEIGLSTQLDVMRADLLLAQARAAAAGQRRALAAAIDRLHLRIGDRTLRADDFPDGELDAVDPLILISAPQDPFDDERWEREVALHRQDASEARDRVTLAERAALVARWTSLPDVRLNATYTGSRRPGSWPRDPFAGWRFGVSTTYALGGGAGRGQIELADMAVRAARRDADQREQEARAFAREALLLVSGADETIAIHQQAAEIAGRQLTLAQLRNDRGLADNGDVVDAEMALFQARTAVIDGQIERARATLGLAAAAGRLRTDLR
jgi:outer membrane protein TolC